MPRKKSDEFLTSAMALVYRSVMLLDKMEMERNSQNEHPNVDIWIDWENEYQEALVARDLLQEQIKSRSVAKVGRKA